MRGATQQPEVKLRTGRHLGRTVYLQTGDTATTADQFLGIFDSAAIATLIVSEINRNSWLLEQIAIDASAT